MVISTLTQRYNWHKTFSNLQTPIYLYCVFLRFLCPKRMEMLCWYRFGQSSAELTYTASLMNQTSTTIKIKKHKKKTQKLHSKLTNKLCQVQDSLLPPSNYKLKPRPPETTLQHKGSLQLFTCFQRLIYPFTSHLLTDSAAQTRRNKLP